MSSPHWGGVVWCVGTCACMRGEQKSSGGRTVVHEGLVFRSCGGKKRHQATPLGWAPPTSAFKHPGVPDLGGGGGCAGLHTVPESERSGWRSNPLPFTDGYASTLGRPLWVAANPPQSLLRGRLPASAAAQDRGEDRATAVRGAGPVSWALRRPTPRLSQHAGLPRRAAPAPLTHARGLFPGTHTRPEPLASTGLPAEISRM